MSGARRAAIAFETTTLAGIRAALRAGLGVTPRSIEVLNPDLKIVDKDLDLPPLGSISYITGRGRYRAWGVL